MSYLYCQAPECGVYLGSLGGDSCSCGWQVTPRDYEHEQEEEIEELSSENIRLQNLVKDLSDWNDKLRERLSYCEAYPANFIGDWEGLTEDERTYFWNHAGTVGWWEILKMVEAKLKQKNGYN